MYSVFMAFRSETRIVRDIHVHVQEYTTYLLNYLINSGFLGDTGSSSKRLWTHERITDFGKCEFSIYALGSVTDLTVHLKEMLWLPIEAFNLSDLHSIRYAYLATDHLCFWYFQQMVTLALPFHGRGKVIKIPRKIEKTIPRRLPAGHGNPFNLPLQDSQNWLHLSTSSQLLIRDILWNDPCCL